MTKKKYVFLSDLFFLVDTRKLRHERCFMKSFFFSEVHIVTRYSETATFDLNEFTKENSVKHTLVAPYHPRSNG